MIMLVRHAASRGSKVHFLHSRQAAIEILQAFGGDPSFLDATPKPDPNPQPNTT